MSARRSCFLALASAAVVVGATACNEISAPEAAGFDDIPARDTTGFIPPMPPLQPRG